MGDTLTYLCESRPWVEKIVVIALNAKSFEFHFILNRAIFLKWQLQLIMNGTKIMCKRMEHLEFLDSLSFLPFALLKLPEAFWLKGAKSWSPHYFNMRSKLDYAGTIPVISYYGVDEMSASERNEFLHWNEGQKDEVFDDRRALESYCQDEVSVSGKHDEC